jgi:DNA-binding IclR family transcriptional regulator
MSGSRAAKRTVSILSLISERPKGITLSEIANELDIPISSTVDILRALLDTGMIEIIDERSKLYSIGVRAFSIGSSYIRNSTLLDKAIPVIKELGSELNKTVFLAKVINDRITYIYKYEPDNILISTCQVGSVNYLHCTALGKSILAYDDDLLKRTLAKPMVKKTEHTIIDPDLFTKEIEKVKSQGYALDNLEQTDYLICIGAPIFDNTNKPIAALSVSSFYKMEIDIEKESQLIKEKAAIISEKLGFVE